MTILTLTKNRRELVDMLYSLTGVKMRYQGPPIFQYTDGTFTIDREGNLLVEDFMENVGVLKTLAHRNSLMIVGMTTEAFCRLIYQWCTYCREFDTFGANYMDQRRTYQ